eukprot:TRINITY_DN5136_c0_g1_i1.p1 TRINITY_DN5136_c0_g1~~TRINITY_DN5136_c0_g1_i1.p1  ORF type:complete len:719 (+),score=133.17 TRINITY_DN5136_c0_g1_i1:73-2157(+)
MGRGLHGQAEIMDHGYLPGAQRHVKENTSTSLPPIMTPRPPPADTQHFSPGPPRGAKRGRPRPGGKLGSKLKSAAGPSLPPVHNHQTSDEVTPALLSSMQGTGLLYFDSTTKGNNTRDPSPSPDSAAASTRYPSKAGDTLNSRTLPSAQLEKSGHTIKPPPKDLRMLRPKLPEQPQKAFAMGSISGDVVGSSLYGHVWRTADAARTARVKPSADHADKVYSNPVVPGAPRLRRPQRQFVRTVLNKGASPHALIDGSVREKVLAVLEHALTAESLPAEVQRRIIHSVSNALLVDESETSAAETSALEDMPRNAQTEDLAVEPDAEQAPAGEDFSTACYEPDSVLAQASENDELRKALDEVTNEAPAVDIDLRELRAASATPVLSVADQADEILLQPRPPASQPSRSRRTSQASFADSVPVSFIISDGSAAADDLATAAVAGAAAEAVKVYEAVPSHVSDFTSEAAALGRCESSAASDRFILDTVYSAVSKALAAEEAALSQVSRPLSAATCVAPDSSAAAYDFATAAVAGAAAEAVKVYEAAPPHVSDFTSEAATLGRCESSAASDSNAAAVDVALGTVSAAVLKAIDANQVEGHLRPSSVDTEVSVQTVMGGTFEEETKDEAVLQMSAAVFANIMSDKRPDVASDEVAGHVGVINLSEDVSNLALDAGLEAFLAEMAGDTFEDPAECVDLDSYC